MNQVKLDIMRAALAQIADIKAHGSSEADKAARIARLALADCAAVIEYRITARTWWPRNGSGAEFKAELRRVDTGEVVIFREGGGSGWEWALMTAMKASGLFPQGDTGSATIYFREVCKVPYEHAEVSRKKDL